MFGLGDSHMKLETESNQAWKVVTTAALSVMITFFFMWLSLGSSAVTRAEAQAMIDRQLSPMQAELMKIESKQDQLQQSIDDLRERLARMESSSTGRYK